MTAAVSAQTQNRTMERKPAATFEAGTVEYNLLYGRLARPRERVQRGNAHQASKPRERWRSAVRTVVKDFLPGTQFQYSKIEKGEIRILCIHPGSGTQPLKASLFKRKLEEAFDGYEALSYCWGNPTEKNTHEILIRDLNATLPEFKTEKYKPSGEVIFRMAVKATFEIPFPIRRNLHQALVKLRSKEDPVNIWVDAICIDQSERGKLEKEEQLSRMADVYNYASNVCIWLGDAFEGASEGFQFVRDIMNLRTFDNLIDTSDSKNRWSHLIEIMNATWFSRRWIIQEVALSRNATVHCANDVIHWDDFADAVSLLTEKIEVLRGKFRDEIFDNVETTSACVLVHILTNVCRKSDGGKIAARLLDLETLVSTLLGFQATFPRDTIYSIMSLARDLPQPNEKWEELHANQLKRPHLNGELTNGKKPGLNAAQAGVEPKKVIGLNPNYKVSTRDLFVAFVTRCIERSRCLDIICRHWAPPVTDTAFGEEVIMPSWISGMSKASFGIPGASQGRQNGENFVAYSPNDQRKRYNASGSYKAQFRMVDDPSRDTLEATKHGGRGLKVSITGGVLTQSPSPSPTLEKPARIMPSIREELETLGNGTHGARLASNNVSAGLTTDAETATGIPRPPQNSLLSSYSPVSDDRLSPVARSGTENLSIPPRKPTKSPDVEREHELSGLLAVRGFVLGKITEHSDVMRGGIIPGDWVYKMGWDKERNENRVPDSLWRLLVADRTQRGGKPPQWYKRACLHGLVDPRVADAQGNLHSVTPADRKISEMTTRYFKRVEDVVWNRRFIEIETTSGFRGPVLGLALKDCTVGDIICILLGCTVPVVLKEVKEPRIPGLYQLVGEAYIHGMMDGEAVQDETLVEELAREFVLT